VDVGEEAEGYLDTGGGAGLDFAYEDLADERAEDDQPECHLMPQTPIPKPDLPLRTLQDIEHDHTKPDIMQHPIGVLLVDLVCERFGWGEGELRGVDRDRILESREVEHPARARARVCGVAYPDNAINGLASHSRQLCQIGAGHREARQVDVDVERGGPPGLVEQVELSCES